MALPPHAQPVIRRLHVLPIGDWAIHAAQSTCWCYPTETSPNVWVHHASDCRERLERQGLKAGAGWQIVAELLQAAEGRAAG